MRRQPLDVDMPSPAGTVLSDSLGRAFREFLTFLQTQGLFVLGSAILSLAFGLFVARPGAADLAPLFEGSPGPWATVAGFGPLLLGGGGAGLVALFLSLLGAAVGVVVADALREERRLGLDEAWAAVSPRLGNLVVTLLAGIGVFVGCVLVMAALVLASIFSFLASPLLVLLGFLLGCGALAFFLYLLLSWALALPVSLFERHGPLGNLQRSARLVAGHRARILGAFLLLALVVYLPSVIVSGVVMSALLGQGVVEEGPFAEAVHAVVGLPFQLVAAFAGSVMLARFYRELAQERPEPPSPPRY